ncbi:MAG: outer membrane protein assembly factor BamD [Acidobacteriota bacterium]
MIQRCSLIVFDRGRLALRHFLPLLLVGSVVLLAACGGAKNRVAGENSALPGRDKELYEQASQKARKGRYDEARLLYNVVITTYADSEYLPLAKLAIADSFYLEGGTSNLEQSIGGYKDFAQYFPTHPKVCDVKHKIAHALMRQMGAYNRDASKAKQAEFQLKAALQSCQTAGVRPSIERDLKDVQQVLGLHELDVARFYINTRQAYKAGESRLRDIISQYPFFSYYDESLYLLGVSLIEQEQPEEAAEYFTKLVRDFPNREFSKPGRDYLEKLGKTLPTPANDDPPPVRPSFVGKFSLILGNNGLDISRDGVLLSRSGEEKDDKDAKARPSDVNSSTGTRAVRASTKINLETPPLTTEGAVPTPGNTAPPASKVTDGTEEKGRKKENAKKKGGQ